MIEPTLDMKMAAQRKPHTKSYMERGGAQTTDTS